MRLIVYESGRTYDLSGEVTLSEDPAAGYIIHGEYGAIIVNKREKTNLDKYTLEKYNELLKSLRVRREKGFDYVMDRVELRDIYFGIGAPSFTLSNFLKFLHQLSWVHHELDYGIFIWGKKDDIQIEETSHNVKQVIAPKEINYNLIWDIYALSGLLGSINYRDINYNDIPERHGMSVKFYHYPYMRLYVMVPMPWRRKSRYRLYEFSGEFDIKELAKFYRRLTHPELIDNNLIRALSNTKDTTTITSTHLHIFCNLLFAYFDPTTPSPIAEILLDVFHGNYYKQIRSCYERFRENLLNLANSYEVIYIAEPTKDFESILKNTHEELINRLSAIGLKYFQFVER